MERASVSAAPTDRSPRNGRIVMISIGERKRSATGCDRPSSLSLSLPLSLRISSSKPELRIIFHRLFSPQFTNINPRDVDNYSPASVKHPISNIYICRYARSRIPRSGFTSRLNETRNVSVDICAR